MKFSTELEVTSSMIADQIVTGFEGGVNYWVDRAIRIKGETTEKPWYSDPKLYEQDFDIEIHAEDEVHHLTPETIKAGLEHMAKSMPSDFRDIVDHQGDASTADVFLQCCLFKDVVYG
jgi:hypothetical protein